MPSSLGSSRLPGKHVFTCALHREAVTCVGSHRLSAVEQTSLPTGSHGSACFVPSAGCFFGDEVRGSGESCAPSDTDASSEAERPGPDQPVPAETLDGPGNLQGSSASSPGNDKTTEHGMEGTGPADQTPRPEPHPGPASTPAELPWTNIDLKEPRKAPSQPAAGFPEATGLSSLGLLPVGLEEPYGADDHPLWAWVSGAGCAVEAHTVLKWFTVQSGNSEHRGPSAPAGAPGGSGPPALPQRPPRAPSVCRTFRQQQSCQEKGQRPGASPLRILVVGPILG